MSKIVLDTNILYYWKGIYKHPFISPIKVDNLSNSHSLFIASPSLIEAIIKHRNNLSAIKACLEPLFKSQLKLISIGFMPIDGPLLYKLYYANRLGNDHAKDIDMLLELRISKEAEFICFFLMAILIGLFDVFHNNRYKFIGTKNDKFIRLTKILLESNINFASSSIRQALVNGYKNNNPQHSFNDIFNCLLHSFIQAWVRYYYLIKHSIPLTFCEISSNKYNRWKKDISNDSIISSLSKHANNPFELVSKRTLNPFKSDYIRNLKSELHSIPLIKEEVLKYILFKISKSFNEKAKIRKNDMIDLLLLYTLSLKDYMILSADNNLIEAIKDIDKDSYDLIVSLNK